MTPLRVLPFQIASGTEQMARDEAMLQSAADRGIASLRFYQWSEPTLSLGYFQPEEIRQTHERIQTLAWVRRASGGATILHHTPHEWTYSFAIPAEAGWPVDRGNAICEFHYIIRDALKLQGISTQVVVCGEEKKLGDCLCFLHHTPGDLALNGSKVVGSAQRKLRGAVLQHGTILLSGSPYTPELPGILELTGKHVDTHELGRELVQCFAHTLKTDARTSDWDHEEIAMARQIDREKYQSAEWNHRR
jgi:lipoyl(octanoyl) transferase